MGGRDLDARTVIGISVVGAGTIGTVHARNIARHPDCELVHVADTDAEKARRLGVELGVLDANTKVDAVLRDDRVHAVVVASSTSAHEEHVLAVAEAGKALLVEKPIASDLQQAHACLEKVTSSGITAATGFNRRLDPTHRALHDAVREGEIGRVETLHIVSRSQSPPDPSSAPLSGGMLREKGSHFFDLACWIAADEPLEVFTAGACLIDPRFADYADLDTAVVTLRMSGGPIASFEFGRRTAYGYDERIEAFGAAGMLESPRQRYRDLRRYRSGAIVEDGLHSGWFDRFAGTYYEELDVFAAAVRGGREVHATLRDGYRAQAVAEAAVKSALENRPVRVDYVHEH